jgi:hypothetical protein
MYMEEKRLTVRMRKYWDLLCKEKEVPKIQQFNHAVIEDLWPYCFMVSIEKGSKPAYKYEYIGEPIVHMYGQDLNGIVFNEGMRHFLGGHVFDKLTEVSNGSGPLEDNGHIVNYQGQQVKYRACFLPFGRGYKDLTHIVVGFSYRVF